MSCQTIQDRIAFYLYNELDERGRAEVEEHAESCTACAAEIESGRSVLRALEARPLLEPPPELLAECRYDLTRSVYRERRQQPMRRWWMPRLLWQPTAALCLLALGFSGGWWIREGRQRWRNPTELSIAGISGVQLDPAGQVQISFDERRPRTLRGDLGDPDVQKFLIYAATQYANPSVRLETIDILRPQAQDRDIRNTLLHLVSRDRNAGVRLKALEALKLHAGHNEVRRALIGVLTNDDNPGMRVEAIDLLMQARDTNLVGVLQGVAEKEQNNYVRMRCQSALRDMNASVETF